MSEQRPLTFTPPLAIRPSTIERGPAEPDRWEVPEPGGGAEDFYASRGYRLLAATVDPDEWRRGDDRLGDDEVDLDYLPNEVRCYDGDALSSKSPDLPLPVEPLVVQMAGFALQGPEEIVVVGLRREVVAEIMAAAGPEVTLPEAVADLVYREFPLPAMAIHRTQPRWTPPSERKDQP